jgi:hypothetical protein
MVVRPRIGIGLQQVSLDYSLILLAKEVRML